MCAAQHVLQACQAITPDRGLGPVRGSGAELEVARQACTSLEAAHHVCAVSAWPWLAGPLLQAGLLDTAAQLLAGAGSGAGAPESAAAAAAALPVWCVQSLVTKAACRLMLRHPAALEAQPDQQALCRGVADLMAALVRAEAAHPSLDVACKAHEAVECVLRSARQVSSGEASAPLAAWLRAACAAVDADREVAAQHLHGATRLAWMGARSRRPTCLPMGMCLQLPRNGSMGEMCVAPVAPGQPLPRCDLPGIAAGGPASSPAAGPSRPTWQAQPLLGFAWWGGDVVGGAGAAGRLRWPEELMQWAQLAFDRSLLFPWDDLQVRACWHGVSCMPAARAVTSRGLLVLSTRPRYPPQLRLGAKHPCGCHAPHAVSACRPLARPPARCSRSMQGWRPLLAAARHSSCSLPLRHGRTPSCRRVARAWPWRCCHGSTTSRSTSCCTSWRALWAAVCQPSRCRVGAHRNRQSYADILRIGRQG